MDTWAGLLHKLPYLIFLGNIKKLLFYRPACQNLLDRAGGFFWMLLYCFNIEVSIFTF
jgi:hypothetical protein